MNQQGGDFPGPLVSPSIETGQELTPGPSIDTAAVPVSVSMSALRPASHSNWMASAQSLVVTVIIAVFVITFVVQAFRIPSESMENTLLVGDYLLVDKAHFGPAGIWRHLIPYQPIRRGDIVVFHYPLDPSQYFVKRVIGLPGDRIRLVRRRVYIDGRPLVEPYVIYESPYPDFYRDNFPAGDSIAAHVGTKWYDEMRKLVEDGELIVPQGDYFVMGDNRDISDDSRYWGFVPRENIVGRPLVIYWSMRSFGDVGDSPETAALPDGKLAFLRAVVSQVFHDIRWHRIMRLVY